MKTLVKLAILLVLANVVVRTGMVALSYYQLKDAAQQEVTWGSSKVPPVQIAAHVLEKAEELGVPLERENVAVSRDKDVTVVEVFYTQPIELFPRFIYPVELSFDV